LSAAGFRRRAIPWCVMNWPRCYRCSRFSRMTQRSRSGVAWQSSIYRANSSAHRNRQVVGPSPYTPPQFLGTVIRRCWSPSPSP